MICFYLLGFIGFIWCWIVGCCFYLGVVRFSGFKKNVGFLLIWFAGWFDLFGVAVLFCTCFVIVVGFDLFLMWLWFTCWFVLFCYLLVCWFWILCFMCWFLVLLVFFWVGFGVCYGLLLVIYLWLILCFV